MKAFLILLILASAMCARGELSPLAPQEDAAGKALQETMIWAGAQPHSQFVAFRKTFVLPRRPDRAVLRLFADVRYVLWINGRYASRGPARFEPAGPEYDSMEVGGLLQPGRNTVVVLVLAKASNGKMRNHAPGLTLRLEADGATSLVTNSTWKWSDQTRYRDPRIDWGNVIDNIDARVEDGDWTQPQYNDAAWKNAAGINGNQWGSLSARRIPLLSETEITPQFQDGGKLPTVLTANQKFSFKTDRLIQAYTVLEIDADAGSELSLDYAEVKYIARAGPQIYVSSDTHGFYGGSITVKSGRVRIRSLRLIERLYPFSMAGSFHSNDESLNKLWAVCAQSCQIFSEDSYVDCADRERTEWMDVDPPAFEITRTAMAGPGAGRSKVYSDARLLHEMIRRTALTLQPEGWVKAHTCSDRFDIHAKMEDRACDWVEGARRYYESTGDAQAVREIWPVIVRQMNYFLDRRTPRGLVLAREWEVWGNPIGYVTCEGAGLNAFIYKALVDAAFLGTAIGEREQSAKFNLAAGNLATAFNTVLWNPKEGTYYSGYTEDYEKAKGDRKVDVPVEGNLIAPTLFPALFALDQGIVPASRRAQVFAYLVAHRQQAERIMTYYYLFRQLYLADSALFDQEILQAFRLKWKSMADWPWQTTWEEFDGGSRAHIYGMFPGYFLSAYVLGVRPDGPVWTRHLLIEPRLGDLTSAKGVVVTEYGPVPVAWKVEPGKLTFSAQIPTGVKATLRIPQMGGNARLTLDQRLSGKHEGRYFVAEVAAGAHEGMVSY